MHREEPGGGGHRAGVQQPASAGEEDVEGDGARARRRRHPRAMAVAREAGGFAVARRGEVSTVEVDACTNDFIRQFREQLWLQRLDSILRYRDTLTHRGQ